MSLSASGVPPALAWSGPRAVSVVTLHFKCGHTEPGRAPAGPGWPSAKWTPRGRSPAERRGSRTTTVLDVGHGQRLDVSLGADGAGGPHFEPHASAPACAKRDGGVVERVAMLGGHGPFLGVVRLVQEEVIGAPSAYSSATSFGSIAP